MKKMWKRSAKAWLLRGYPNFNLLLTFFRLLSPFIVIFADFMRNGFLYALVIIALVTSSCSKMSRIEKSHDPAKKLAYANELYGKKKYMQANQLYSELLTVYKGTKEFEDMYYNYAYSSLKLEDYEQAAYHFKNFVDIFPNSPRAEEMDYMQAYCYYKLSPRVELDQKSTTQAISAMQTFIDTHPGSARIAEATRIIDLCRKKLEEKEFKAAELYYDIGLFHAAAVSFKNLMRDYPDSQSSDQYKYMAIKSYYEYAENSIIEKQSERYEQVVTEYLDFADRYPQSTYLKDAEQFYTQTQDHLKSLQNEQVKEKPKQ